MNPLFTARTSVEQVEEGVLLTPKFDANGLMTVVTTDVNTGEVLMHAYMNEEALVKTELDYQNALQEIEKLFDAEPNSPECDLSKAEALRDRLFKNWWVTRLLLVKCLEL